MLRPAARTALRAAFGDQAQENVLLAPYTSARIGGPADLLVTVRSADELARAVTICWQTEQPYLLLGAGSNVLVSDNGVRGVVLLNRARAVEFVGGAEKHVWAESGAAFANVAHRAAAQGYTGLEWAVTVPGTVGGAVYGNAGAFGGDVAHDLLAAELLTPLGRDWWPPQRLEYGYRTSILKRGGLQAVVLSAKFNLKYGNTAEIQAKIEQFTRRRKATQPPGASMGSMFKNPPGDFAGRLIEAAGLKGTRIGNAEISTVHANFFLNTGNTRAADIKALIELAQQTVLEKFGVKMELEVELIGEW
ncbi:MAG: UDP-N-acetylmuramate dehydrogenase [Anaerolineales bacterium]|nr:UDP-N-acetylmuramate dehydrogenase [Anaerolineales bacterium]MCX7754974.1 UDP-N-acetylmuramate dehydrogenase [Anaerolineales bacterium]MDW8277352.1 UDP-N-acetylmuramate dehydrogenase [Anaerolineales bacterium]